MILPVAAWGGFTRIRAGFGNRAAEKWTHQPNRTWVNQIHSDQVLHATQPGFQGDGDALITSEPGLLLEVRTADCLPLLLFDPVAGSIGAVHAGWRGVRSQIAEKTVRQMSLVFGSRPEDIYAAIGPHIRQCCFEVGPEVAVEFKREGRCHLDLSALMQDQLRQAGVSQIERLPECSYCDRQFHSYRRDGLHAGRMEAGIVLEA